MAKNIDYNADARSTLKEGVDKLANAVRLHWVRRVEMLL